MMRTILSLYCFLLSCFALRTADNGYPETRSHLESHQLMAIQVKDIPLVVGAGWYNFSFTNASYFADKNFIFTTTEPTILKVTDALCGDTIFLVLDNGTPIFQTSAASVTCNNYTPLPDVAWPGVGWSSGYTFLPAGSHSISIQAVVSPYTAGNANIRVDYNFA